MKIMMNLVILLGFPSYMQCSKSRSLAKNVGNKQVNLF